MKGPLIRFEQREAPILAAAPEPMSENRAEKSTHILAIALCTCARTNSNHKIPKVDV